ncbi:MAG: hypothetical protein M3075_00935 [Candidatus Dormibacteraeota bacterium]|nr:hypothetical protein [Candidatus Dormibacteraeota bacterium]
MNSRHRVGYLKRVLVAAIGAASGVVLQPVLAQAAISVPTPVPVAVPAVPVPSAVPPPVRQALPQPVTQAVPPPPVAVPPVAPVTPVTPPTVSAQVGLPPVGTGATATVGTGAGTPSVSVTTPAGSATVSDPAGGVPPGSVSTPTGAGVSLPTGALPSWGGSTYASTALDPAGIAIPGATSGGAGALSNPGAVAALGIPAGGETVGGLSAGLSEAAFGTSLSASVNPASADTGQGIPMVCPELVFAPLIAGCQTLFNPANGSVPGLASTGMPILSGLAGLLLIGIGGLVYRRSRHLAGAAAAGEHRQASGWPSRKLPSAGADSGLVAGRGSRRGRSLAPR